MKKKKKKLLISLTTFPNQNFTELHVTSRNFTSYASLASHRQNPNLGSVAKGPEKEQKVNL